MSQNSINTVTFIGTGSVYKTGYIPLHSIAMKSFPFKPTSEANSKHYQGTLRKGALTKML
jgi:hypothetical protein